MSKLLQRCIESGLKMTEQRKVILKVLEDSEDHPSVEVVCERARKFDSSVSIATVYRTLGLLDRGIPERGIRAVDRQDCRISGI